MEVPTRLQPKRNGGYVFGGRDNRDGYTISHGRNFSNAGGSNNFQYGGQHQQRQQFSSHHHHQSQGQHHTQGGGGGPQSTYRRQQQPLGGGGQGQHHQYAQSHSAAPHVSQSAMYSSYQYSHGVQQPAGMYSAQSGSVPPPPAYTQGMHQVAPGIYYSPSIACAPVSGGDAQEVTGDTSHECSEVSSDAPRQEASASPIASEVCTSADGSEINDSNPSPPLVDNRSRKQYSRTPPTDEVSPRSINSSFPSPHGAANSYNNYKSSYGGNGGGRYQDNNISNGGAGGYHANSYRHAQMNVNSGAGGIPPYRAMNIPPTAGAAGPPSMVNPQMNAMAAAAAIQMPRAHTAYHQPQTQYVGAYPPYSVAPVAYGN